MIPTVGQVYDATRSVLGDERINVFTNTLLEPKWTAAYAELFRAMQGAQNPAIRQEVYYIVPANTGYLAPVTAGIDSLGEIESIEERGGVTAWTITAVTPATSTCTLTTAATTLATGNQVTVATVGGISYDVNGLWTVTVNSTISTTLNGCAATGTYTSGGVLAYSTEQFLEMTPQQRVTFIDPSPQSAFLYYAWERDIIRFQPLSAARQLRITYTMSGNAPTTTTASIGIDDSLDFLMYRVAGLAAESKGMLTRAQLYNARACGPRWDSEGVAGGLLGQLLTPGIRNMQRLPPPQRRSAPFGRSRSRRTLVW